MQNNLNSASSKKQSNDSMEDKPAAVSEKKEEVHKPLVINDAVIEGHRQAHTFRSVAPGKSHDSPVTGASSRWLKKGGGNIIYDSTFYTVGTEQQVRDELALAGASAGEIDDAVANAFTFDSVTTEGDIRDRYLAMVEEAKSANITARDFGLDWAAVAPFFQAKKSDIVHSKGKAPAKGKKRTDTKRTKVPKKKTAADVQKEILEKKSDFVLVFNPKGFSRMKETSIGRMYYYNKEKRVAFQTPEELAAAKAALDFGNFDVDHDFDAWYQLHGKKPAAAPAEAKGSQSPVRAKPAPAAAKAAPAAKPAKALPVAKAASAAPPAAVEAKPAEEAAKPAAVAKPVAAAPRRRAAVRAQVSSTASGQP